MNTTISHKSLNSGIVSVKVTRQTYGRVTDNLIKAVYPDSVRGWLREYRESNWHNIKRGLDKIVIAAKYQIPTVYGVLKVKVIRLGGDIIDFGIVSCRVVTTTGAAFVIDAWQNSVELENMKYHGIGTGTNAENVADSALQTELTTQYNPDSTRATGSLAEGASSNIFRTIGTNAVDASVAITEHGIFSQAATGGGVLFDRSVFSAINLTNGDQIQTTYEWTLSVGG